MATRVSESERLTLEEASADKDLSKVIDWIEHFLGAPHADLGRSGDVCPFARTAMLKRSVEFYRNHSESVEGLSRDIELHMEEFEQSDTFHDIYRCRTIVPIGLKEAASAVEYVQKQLKPAFVERRLMVGQFYQGCEVTGLWSKGFRPLQSPVPLIAIRHMVPTDIAFLYDNERYTHAYLEKFGKRGRIALQQFQAAMEIRK
jgi:hypothetical protein